MTEFEKIRAWPVTLKQQGLNQTSFICFGYYSFEEVGTCTIEDLFYVDISWNFVFLLTKNDNFYFSKGKFIWELFSLLFWDHSPCFEKLSILATNINEL